jgi:hypothetical protein
MSPTLPFPQTSSRQSRFEDYFVMALFLNAHLISLEQITPEEKA